MKILAAILTLLILSSPVWAGCAEEERALTQEIQQWSARQQQGSGMCQLGRDAERIFRKAAAFYQRCPINDPSGEMASYSQQMIEWGQEVQRQVCSG